MCASWTKTLLKSKRLLTFSGRTDIKVSCDYNNHPLQNIALFFPVLFIHLKKEIKGNEITLMFVNLHCVAFPFLGLLCVFVFLLSHMFSDDLDHILGVHKELIVLSFLCLLLFFFFKSLVCFSILNACER